MPSGVGVMSREFVMQTCHHFNWVQVGAAIKHPEQGKIFDISEAIAKDTGVPNASIKIYPFSGYGSPDLVRQLMHTEKVDAIMIYTDPRFWIWLFEMAHEIRQHIPIMYYNIWDDLPYPFYNRPYYDSVDLLLNISRQTTNLVKNVRSKDITEDWQVQYVPHGINEDDFYPVRKDTEVYEKMTEFRKKLLGKDDHNFVVLYNNRNIRRKQPGDIMLAFKSFCDSLPKEHAEKCVLLYHTAVVDQNGTDLEAVRRTLIPEYNVKFSMEKVDIPHMNYLYNIADITINIASAEGFGLATAESLMAGTPILVNTTGGLQDQVGFKKQRPLTEEEKAVYEGAEEEPPEFVNEYLTVDDYTPDWPSNSDKRYTEHGEWAYPIWPQVNLVGSVPTPYIYDSRADVGDAAKGLMYWYNMEPHKRKEAGLKGREFVLREDIGMSATNMGKRFLDYMNLAFEKWKPIERYQIVKVEDEEPEEHRGILDKVKKIWI